MEVPKKESKPKESKPKKNKPLPPKKQIDPRKVAMGRSRGKS